MGSPLRIYGGGAQVSLYDDTNGVYLAGATGEESRVEEVLNQTGLSDRNKVQLARVAQFEVPVLQTDPNLFSELKARRGVLHRRS